MTNKFGTGIAARVKWYNPDDVKLVAADPRGDNQDTPDIDESRPQLKIGFAKPVQEKAIALGQESCFAGTRPSQRPHIALISVVGAKYANASVSVAMSTVIAVAGAVACPATAFTACPAVAVAVAATVAAVGSGAISLATLGLPEAKEVFYVSIPGKLNVSGTAFSPTATESAPIR